jgi:hypothetical protein
VNLARQRGEEQRKERIFSYSSDNSLIQHDKECCHRDAHEGTILLNSSKIFGFRLWFRFFLF